MSLLYFFYSYFNIYSLLQGSIYRWVHLHRYHHEKFRKEEDPYHSSRTFYDAQVRAQITNLTQEQEDEMIKIIDMSDLEKDKVVMFQKKYKKILLV